MARAKSGLSDFGTADVTVGSTTKNGIQDYYDGAVKHGTSYSVKNIKAKKGYTLTSTNSYSGTVNGDVSVAPTFVTNKYTVVFNGNGNSGGNTAKQTYTYFENINKGQPGICESHRTYVLCSIKALECL